jgi:hypothetical protein
VSRPWTARERDLLRLHYGPLARLPWPTAAIADALGRARRDVWSAARRFGLCWRSVGRPSARWLRRHYDAGMSDAQLAWAVGCDRMTVLRWRGRHGLPPNRTGNGAPAAHLPPRPSCRAGHPLDGTNLYVAPGGRRRCRECLSAGARRRRAGGRAVA